MLLTAICPCAQNVSPLQFLAAPLRGERRKGRRGRAAFKTSVHSHNTGLNILAHALVVMVIIRATSGGMERRNAIEIEDEIFSVTHWGGVMLITGQSHWKKKGEEKKSFQ